VPKKRSPWIRPALAYNDWKSIVLFEESVQRLFDRYHKHHDSIIFGTFTFRIPVYTPKLAARYFRALNKHLNARTCDYIKVVHKHRRGKVHFHFLAVVDPKIDIRTGFRRKPRRRENRNLRAEKKYWSALFTRLTISTPAGKQRIWGKFQIEPILGTAKQVATYLQKSWVERLGLAVTGFRTKRPPGWPRAKLWTASPGVRAHWRAPLHGKAFTIAARRLTKTLKLPSMAALKAHFPKKRWAVRVRRVVWEMEQEREVARKARWKSASKRAYTKRVKGLPRDHILRKFKDW